MDDRPKISRDAAVIALALERLGDANAGAGAIVAHSLDGVADALGSVAAALRMLGLADAATPMGAIEALSVSVEKVGQAIGSGLESVADAVDRHGE